MRTKNLYNILLQSLRLVASPSEVQITSVPQFASMPDEVALTFNDAYLIAPQLLDENLISIQAFDLLKELVELFEKMSKDKSLWTLGKLESDTAWKRSRELALKALQELDEPYGRPNLDYINWIK